MRLTLSPNPGEMLLRFVGDRLTFRLTPERRTPEAYLRTNIGRGPILHAEVLQEYYREDISLYMVVMNIYKVY